MSAPRVIRQSPSGPIILFAPSFVSSQIVGLTADEGLRALEGADGVVAVADGYHTPGDRGSGEFVWETTPQPNDDGLFIGYGVPYGADTAAPGWRRLTDGGALDVAWFGALGDYDPTTGIGGDYDQISLQRALEKLNADPRRWSLTIPDGIYKITGPLSIRSGYNIRGNGEPILWGVSASSILQVAASLTPPTIADSVLIEGLTLLGNGTTALDLVAIQGSKISVYIGGDWTNGVRSAYTSGQSGVAYNCDFDFRRFAWAVGRYPFPEPVSPDNGLIVFGAWTASKVHVDWVNVADYSIRIQAQGPQTGLGNLEITGMIQGAGIFGGLGIACQIEGVNGATIGLTYTEGNVADVRLEGCEGTVVSAAYANVRLRNCTGCEVTSAIRVDADNTNSGCSVHGQLTTSEQPATGLIAPILGLVTDHFARENGRIGIYASGSRVVDEQQLIVNGAMQRFNTSGTCTLWGTTAWSTFPTTQTGDGLADTTRTDGSPYACKVITTGDQVMAIKVTDPLPASFLGELLTISLKLRVTVIGIAGAVQVTDLATVAWDPTAPTIDLWNAGGVVSTANPTPVEDGFSLIRFTRRVTQAMIDQGIQLVLLAYSGATFYLSELQAFMGRASPRIYQPGRSWGNAVTALPSGAIEVVGLPGGATDPFYGEPWLVGDRALSASPAPGTPAEWVFTAASQWSAIVPIRTAPRTVAGTSDELTASDFGSVIRYTNGSPVAVTVPPGLPEGFYCTIVQVGAGQVTLAAGGGVTLQQASGLTTAAQFAAAGVQYTAADTYVVGGNVTP